MYSSPTCNGPFPPRVLRKKATSTGAARLGFLAMAAISCSGDIDEPSMRTP